MGPAVLFCFFIIIPFRVIMRITPQSIHQQLQEAFEEQESLKLQTAEYARQVARVEELLAQKVSLLRVYLGCVRLTVFRNRNTWNTSWKSFVFVEIHIKIVKHFLKCYFKHIYIFIILAASKRAKHTVLIITPRILIPE